VHELAQRVLQYGGAQGKGERCGGMGEGAQGLHRLRVGEHGKGGKKRAGDGSDPGIARGLAHVPADFVRCPEHAPPCHVASDRQHVVVSAGHGGAH